MQQINSMEKDKEDSLCNLEKHKYKAKKTSLRV